MGGHRFTRCPLCGDRISAYHPMIITRYGARRSGRRGRQPVLPETDSILLEASSYGIESYERGENG